MGSCNLTYYLNLSWFSCWVSSFCHCSSFLAFFFLPLLFFFGFLIFATALLLGFLILPLLFFWLSYFATALLLAFLFLPLLFFFGVLLLCRRLLAAGAGFSRCAYSTFCQTTMCAFFFRILAGSALFLLPLLFFLAFLPLLFFLAFLPLLFWLSYFCRCSSFWLSYHCSSFWLSCHCSSSLAFFFLVLFFLPLHTIGLAVLRFWTWCTFTQAHTAFDGNAFFLLTA